MPDRDPYPRARAEKLRRTHGTTDPTDVVREHNGGYVSCGNCGQIDLASPGELWSRVHIDCDGDDW